MNLDLVCIDPDLVFIDLESVFNNRDLVLVNLDSVIILYLVLAEYSICYRYHVSFVNEYECIVYCVIHLCVYVEKNSSASNSIV